MSATAEKLTYLEETLSQVAYAQLKTEMSLQCLSREMRDFKDEMLEFKDEMRGFKDEMSDFKDEMRDFKDEMSEFKNEMSEFKDEMRDFKDEMGGFKDEMRDFKDEMGGFKNEMSEYKDWSKNQIISMNRQWGDLANKMGTLVEDIVAPNIPRIAKKYFGCDDLDYFAVRVKKKSRKRNDQRKEFDVIAAGEGIFIINETKSSPEIRDVDKLAEFVNSGTLFDYFPEYEGCRICPVFAALYMDDSLVTYLARKGIYALALKDDTMDILNWEDLACS